MNHTSSGYSRAHYEGMLSAISVGFFLILIGSLFVTTPGLLNNLVNFLNHFTNVHVPNTGAQVPAPDFSMNYLDVYTAARQFSLIWGVFLIATFGARFIIDSPLRRKAQNIGDIVFWLGATYAIQTFLVIPSQASNINMTNWGQTGSISGLQ